MFHLTDLFGAGEIERMKAELATQHDWEMGELEKRRQSMGDKSTDAYKKGVEVGARIAVATPNISDLEFARCAVQGGELTITRLLDVVRAWPLYSRILGQHQVKEHDERDFTRGVIEGCVRMYEVVRQSVLPAQELVVFPYPNARELTWQEKVQWNE